MIVLASKSSSRQAMLQAAGISFEAIPASIDERAAEAAFASSEPENVVAELSKAKALAVSEQHAERFVLGSDSIVTVAGRRFDKPADRAQAAEHLRYFSGKTLELHAGAAIVHDGAVQFACHDRALLQVRNLSEDFIADYLAAEWPEVAHCVGVFRIEGLGVQLFEQIDGSHFTILGMPLMQVLQALRQLRAIGG